MERVIKVFVHPYYLLPDPDKLTMALLFLMKAEMSISPKPGQQESEVFKSIDRVKPTNLEKFSAEFFFKIKKKS